MVKIFISHSSDDRKLVEKIVNLFMRALKIEHNHIRCTSIPGFRLSAGQHTSIQLRNELENCEIVIGLLTKSSIKSLYVMFELGAGWGLKKKVIPISGPEFDLPQDLKPPLTELHVMHFDNKDEWFGLIRDISSTLNVQQNDPASYISFIEEIATYTHP